MRAYNRRMVFQRPGPRRLVVLLCGTLGLACLLVAGTVLAQGPVQFFRIATGSTAGTYFPIGSIIASAVSSPPGSRSCEDGGSCGVPGVIAVAQTTQGSIENVNLISGGKVESGFSQADIAYWAYYGDELFRGTGRRTTLRAIASLYPETVHVVVRKFSGIRSIRDLRGRRVSVGEPGSGTMADAELILAAYGLKKGDFRAMHLAPGPSADMMEEAELDAFVMVGGYPLPAIAGLADNVEIMLLPINGAEAQALREEFPFFVQTRIPDGIYRHVPHTDTVSVQAQWIASAELSADFVYAITRALWHENTRKLLDSGHPEGQRIRLDTALNGVAIPLHDGAARYYREAGILK